MKLIFLFSVVTDQPTRMFDWGNIFNNQFFLAYNLAQAILVLYGLSLFLLFFYSVLQFSLTLKYRKSHCRPKVFKIECKKSCIPLFTGVIPVEYKN